MRTLSFNNFYFGEHALRSADEIVEVVCRAKSFNDKAPETLLDAKTLLLFKSSDQQSWLVRTNCRLYKLIDDRRKPDTIINWSRSLQEIRGAQVILDENKSNFSYIRFSFRPNKRYLMSDDICSITAIMNFIKA